jgi:hypothetical protein
MQPQQVTRCKRNRDYASNVHQRYVPSINNNMHPNRNPTDTDQTVSPQGSGQRQRRKRRCDSINVHQGVRSPNLETVYANDASPSNGPPHMPPNQGDSLFWFVPFICSYYTSLVTCFNCFV